MLPVDPNPVDIIQKERIEELIQSVRFSRTILSQSGLMRAYLRYFVRRHLALTVLKDHPNLFPTDEPRKMFFLLRITPAPVPSAARQLLDT